MRTVIRNSYTPKLGDYCNTLVVDKETGSQYLFDKDGVWTLLSLDGEWVIAEAVAQANAYTDDVAEGKVDKEAGKGLSENDFTDADKEKLDRVQENVIEVIKRNGVALPITDKTVDVEVPTATSALTNDSGYITNEVDNLVNYYDKDATDELIAEEALTRDAADQDLQEQIDAISSASDVVDVVGTYAELQNYDTSSLSDNDIIKVLSDSTHDDATTYYRWTNNQFTYIGSEGPFYTKGEADATFVPLTRTINGKGLNSDVVLTAADVNALPASTVIPTVNDATLTIQKNGSTVTTFTANSSQNATANITVPTKVSDITNDLNFVEEADLADVAFSGDYADLTGTPTIPTKTSDLTNDSNFVSDANYVHTDNNFTTTEKNKLAGIAAGAEVNVQSDWAQTNSSADDFIKNKPTIPTKTSDLTNDSGFITSAAVPTKTSDLTNDSGFITNQVSNLANYYDQSTINNMFNALPVVPTKTSDLANDGADGTSTYIEASNLAAVATSGSYNDLTNKPTVPEIKQRTGATTTTDITPLYVAGNGSTTMPMALKTHGADDHSGSFSYVNINEPTSSITEAYVGGYVWDEYEDWWRKMNEVRLALYSDIPTVPTKTSDLTNDSGFLTSVAWGDVTGKPTFATVATSGSYNDLSDKPTIPTVNDATLTIQRNSTNVGTFTANASSNKTINITVPTTAADVSALPASTKYGASIAVSVNTTDYKVTTTLKDQDGNTLGTAQVIDLPLESVVVNGSYDNTNKKIVLTLQNGNTIDIPVADLVAGLQSEITSTNKLVSDLVDDTGQAHKFMTSAEKTKLSGIAAGAEVNVQSDWAQTTTTADDYIKNKPQLAPVATSGSYNDLNNRPTIPTAGAITSGNTGYATGGDVYDAIGDVESILATLNNGGGAQ